MASDFSVEWQYSQKEHFFAKDQTQTPRQNVLFKKSLFEEAFNAVFSSMVARWFVFKPKIPIWVKFEGP
jgi:hypothetical protein